MATEPVGQPAVFHPPGNHDHSACISAALAAAETACERRGLRLTDLRRQVRELVWEGHAPVKAYDLLEQDIHERRPAYRDYIARTDAFLPWRLKGAA